MSENTIQNSFTIDANDRILEVNDLWDGFADENDGHAARGEYVIHKPLWNFVAGQTIKHLYEQIIAQVRKGKEIRFNYRCDSPNERRIFEMVITHLNDGIVRFDSLVHNEDEQNKVAPRPYDIVDSELLITCSWCKKVTSGDDIWVEIPNAIELFRMFETMPTLSHGICMTCYDETLAKFRSESPK